ncbi:MAG: hypothetical protein ACP5T6_03920, partial [Candidatus Micrarchaeia archaeon]
TIGNTNPITENVRYIIKAYQGGFVSNDYGFGPGVLVAQEGSSGIYGTSLSGKIYYKITALFPTNWGSANGYLLYQKDPN